MLGAPSILVHRLTHPTTLKFYPHSGRASNVMRMLYARASSNILT